MILKEKKLFDFPVKRESIINPMGVNTGYDTIYRADNGSHLGIVSADYQMVKHSDAIFPILKEFEKRKIEIIPNKIGTTNGGARLFASFLTTQQYDLGFQVKKDKKVGDIISPGFTIINSYDRSLRFSLKLTIFRLACTNGLLTSEEWFVDSKRHTSSLNTDLMIEQFLTSSSLIEEKIIPSIRAMRETKIEPIFLQEQISLSPGWLQEEILQYLQDGQMIVVDEKDNKEIEIDITDKEFNLWDCLNAFTFSLTHSENASIQNKFELSKTISKNFFAKVA